MNWLLCIVVTSGVPGHHGVLMAAPDYSRCWRGHSLSSDTWNFSPDLGAKLKLPQSVPDTGHQGSRSESEEICLQNQCQAAKTPSHSALIPLCSSIRNKTNKPMAGRALSGVPRLIWNILGECLDSDFDSENAGNGIEHFWARGCWLPNRSLTNILYFLFWARAAAGVMRCEGENH